jgi:hypothetical protein
MSIILKIFADMAAPGPGHFPWMVMILIYQQKQ